MNRPSPARVQVPGPLEAYAGSFREELSRLGYSSSSAAGHLQLMAHLSRWLADTGLDPSELTVSCGMGQHIQRQRGHLRVGSLPLGIRRKDLLAIRMGAPCHNSHISSKW